MSKNINITNEERKLFYTVDYVLNALLNLGLMSKEEDKNIHSDDVEAFIKRHYRAPNKYPQKAH